MLQAVHLGCVATEDSAAHMYDRAAICVRGPEAILNFPRQWYDSDGLLNGWVGSKAQLQSVLSKFTDNHNAAPRYCVHPGCIGSSVTCCCCASMQRRHFCMKLIACMPADLLFTMHARLNMIVSAKPYKLMCRVVKGYTPLPSHTSSV